MPSNKTLEAVNHQAVIAVMGASGRTGSQVARALLAEGRRVRVLARSPQRVADLVAAGAEVVVGDGADAGVLGQLFTDAAAAYALLPFDPTRSGYLAAQDRQSAALVEAVGRAGLPRLVFLSSVGGGSAGPTGVIRSLHQAEQRLRALTTVELTLLRPGAFYEGVLDQLPLMRGLGLWPDVVDPDLAYPMVGTADIAAVAVEELTRGRPAGLRIVEIDGPEVLSHAELARRIGAAIGQPGLRAERVDAADQAAALEAAGLAPDLAALVVEFGLAINTGLVAASTAAEVSVQPIVQTRTPGAFAVVAAA